MLNEAFHDENLSGIIMTRPTKSEILYRQQLGRGLNRDGNEIPVIFDLVNNIDYFEQLRIEIDQIIQRGIREGKKELYAENILEKFQIFSEQLDIIKAFTGIEEKLKEYLRGEASVSKTFKICKRLYEAGLNFNELKLQKRNSFIKFSDLPLSKEILGEIMEETQTPSDFPIGARINLLRRAFAGSSTTTIITEEDKKNIASIPRNYTHKR